MALETKIRVSGLEHLVIDRSVGIMAGGAAFAHRFMLENKRSALGSMASAAGVVLGQQGSSPAADSRSLVGVVTIAATDLSIQHRMAVGQLKLPLFVQVTLEAGFGCAFGIDNGMVRTTALAMNAAWAVARFAANVFGIRPFRFEARVCRGFKVADEVGMTLGATLGSGIFGASDLRWNDDRASQGRT